MCQAGVACWRAVVGRLPAQHHGSRRARATTPSQAERLHRRAGAAAQLALAQDRPSLEDVLPTMTMPCLPYAGDADANYAGVTACCKQIPNVTFVSLPGLNHAEALMQLHVVLPHITQFLATVPL